MSNSETKNYVAWLRAQDERESRYIGLPPTKGLHGKIADLIERLQAEVVEKEDALRMASMDAAARAQEHVRQLADRDAEISRLTNMEAAIKAAAGADCGHPKCLPCSIRRALNEILAATEHPDVGTTPEEKG